MITCKQLSAFFSGLEMIPNSAPESVKEGLRYSSLQEFRLSLCDSIWFGLGALHNQRWPLNKLSIKESKFMSYDNGPTGLLGLIHPFVFNSDGHGFLFSGDNLSIAWNAPTDIESTPEEPLRPLDSCDGITDQTLVVRGDNFSVTVFCYGDAKEVVEAFYATLPPIPSIPDSHLLRPMFTTWAEFKNDISQNRILEYAAKLRSSGFKPDNFGIDAKWQREFGELEFDEGKFPDAKAMISELRKQGFHVTLWSAPFFPDGGDAFQDGVNNNALLLAPDGQPFVGKWWEGEAAVVNAANKQAMQWYLARHRICQGRYGNEGFKFDAGEAQFFDISSTYSPGFYPNDFTSAYVREIASHFPWSDARTGWNNQTSPLLFRQWDKGSSWGENNGLKSCITQALTLNVLGYRNSFPDMIGGNAYGNSSVDAELLIRWTQAVAPMPIIQFSLAPWRFGSECADICASYSALREDLAIYHRLAISEHAPIIRPIWWECPNDEIALQCDDQYMVGNQLVVAPILTPSTSKRDIYLPPGRWTYYFDRSVSFQGPRHLNDFPAELSELPLFVRGE